MGAAPNSITLIGFGEVGQTLAKDFLAGGVKEIRAWDTAFISGNFSNDSRLQANAAEALGVVATRSSAEAVRDAQIIISAVTAGSDEAAANTAAQAIERGALFADLNSVSPGSKQRVAEIIEAKGARFVEVAVMSPINPRGLKSPMLLGGAHAQAFAELMAPFHVDMTPVSEIIGKAAATKMCRSVLYKGLEALFLESMTAARHYGVETEVLASLTDTFERGWPETARYMISRALIHGRRRAEEMREAAKTVQEAGLEPLLASGTAQRQDWAADQAAHMVGIVPAKAPLDALLDALLRETAPAASK